jgi:hypothetical protein
MLIIPPPSCLDSAYERRAIDQGLVTKPVFPENKEYLEWKVNVNQSRWKGS